MNHISSKKSTMKALIVEDSYFNQSILMEILDSLGLEYDIAKDGKEAINRVKMIQYNIIFMDINMPNQDGLSASKQIKSELHVRTPIVIMTANKIINAYEEMNHFIDAYIEKPLNKNKVIKILENLSLKIEDLNDGLEDKMTIDIRKISRIDTDKGLSFSGGSIDVYINTLYSFTNNFRELLEISEEEYYNDLQKTQRLFHTLKGASLGIGAMELSILSEYVEKTITRDSYNNKSAVLDKCLYELKEIIEIIEGFLNSTHKKSFNKKNMLSLLELLTEQIMENDNHSYENFLTLKKQLSCRQDLYMTLERIKLQLEMCDFQDALISISLLREKV